MSVRHLRGMLLVPVAGLLAATVGGTAGAADVKAHLNEYVHLTTTLKSLNQSVAFPRGTFKGTVDAYSGALVGDLSLPPATTTVQLAGIGLANATISVIDAKRVAGVVVFGSTYSLDATATVWVKVDSLEPIGLPVNLVGNRCMTRVPVVLTMKGSVSLFGPSTFSGTYTLPPLAHCGLATAALNAALPGPGNTFSTTLSPYS